MMRWIQASLTTFVVMFTAQLSSTVVIVEAPDGSELELYLPEGREVQALNEAIEAHYGVKPDLQRFRMAEDQDQAGGDDQPPSKVQRDWERKWTESEFKDIKFIIKALAYKTNAWLLFNQSEMKKRGKRIEVVHPLRFLEAIFTDDEMIFAMHEITGHRWDGLMTGADGKSGLSGSLDDEMQRENMKAKYRKGFAKAIDVKLAAINPSIQAKEWEILVRKLIKLVPLPEDDDDWDM